MNTNREDKKLLAICDLSMITWCVGEFLHFQMNTLINRIVHEVDKIDIIWLYDSEHPATPKALRSGWITKENSAKCLKEVLSLGRVNPHLGSFTVMNFEGLEEFVENNSDKYVIDPSMEIIRKRKIIYREFSNKIVNFYNERDFLPLLSCSSDMVSWARHFLRKTGGYSVVVQLRNSPFGSGKKKKLNSPFNEWLGFFTECRKKFKEVKFVVVSKKEEIDKSFEKSARSLGNVIFSKKHGKFEKHTTTVEQDCALIQASKICIGSSGIMSMAWYCGIPYLFFNPGYGFFKKTLNSSGQFPFATPFQRWIRKPVRKESIMKEFKELYNQVTKQDKDSGEK